MYELMYVWMQGDTLMHTLCKRGQVDAVTILLRKGVGLNSLNKVIPLPLKLPCLYVCMYVYIYII